MSDKLKIGLIGLGTAGLRHAKAIGKSSEGLVVAAADPSGSTESLAKEHGFAWFSEYEAMLNQIDMDAVIISVPHVFLPATAIAAARHGKHILLEKPMATTTAEADKIVQTCRTAGVRLMVNFVHRFRPEYQKAWELIQAGIIGRPVMAIDTMSTGLREMPKWVWDKQISGGGMMMYGGVHSVDRLTWLMGSPVTDVGAEMGTFSYPVEVEDNLAGTLSFKNGSIGVVIHHRSTAKRTLGGWHTLVYGTRGAMKLVSGKELIVESENETVRVPGEPEDRFLGAFQEFSDSILSDRDPVPSGEEGLHVLDVTLSLYASVHTKSRVHISANDTE